ncbi:hypothetical protein LTR62_002381 [Meristemomyces frigidus]|uniref:asparagine--tRNA ligase n=1 Tax=Meristemomyces frigidus TaxID=1508187 RepID=A0AAN7TM43_9PEZI|nr:hypothetical protein LTR62_002381 [Meristemomyces frigidus]
MASKGEVYVDEDTGKDETSSGTQSQPYKTVQYAYLQHGADTQYHVRDPESQPDEVKWKPAAKAAIKKAANYADAQRKKAAKADELAIREKQEQESREKSLEEAKKIVIKDDASLPAAKKIPLGEKIDLEPAPRVQVVGRVTRQAKQSKLLFITLRDGTGYMQCLLAGDLANTYHAQTLTLETSIMIKGQLRAVEKGKTAPMNRELQADYFEIIGKAPGGDDAITNRVPPAGAENAQARLDMRHLAMRDEEISNVLYVRQAVEHAFSTKYWDLDFVKVSPPALVQTQVEGGSTLFEFDYYNEKAYLTQSSQLYLETAIPSFGNVYCIEKSFRAEKSLTRRHLSEYTHIEGELDFITFDDLLTHLEDLMCGVLEIVLAHPRTAAMIKKLNPDFTMPVRPFKRMKYTDAIDWLNAHDIKNENDQPHAFGDDIAEAAERRMTDILNVPIFLTHFPTEIKAFYMQKDPTDPRVTESVDCLMPGVGEIIGGSMRMDDYAELMEAYQKNGIPSEPYYWYTDLRRYGTSPHGGYGLGLERFLAWLCKQHTVRDTCLFPRYMGRCKP